MTPITIVAAGTMAITTIVGVEVEITTTTTTEAATSGTIRIIRTIRTATITISTTMIAGTTQPQIAYSTTRGGSLA
jgi:hypothetical protein